MPDEIPVTPPIVPETPTSEAQNPETPARTGLSHDEALDALKKVRQEAADSRRKLQAYEKAKQEQDERDLSELQKAQKRLTQLEADHQTLTTAAQSRALRYEVQLSAAKLGIVDPDAAARLLDNSELTFAEDGSPTNVESLLKALVKARPWLAPPSDPPARPTAPRIQTTNPAQNVAGNSDSAVTITADQYLDQQFRTEFVRTHGMDLLTAQVRGQLKIV